MKPAGSFFGFQPHPLPMAGEDWRPLEHAVAAWVLAHGGDARLARLAARTSLAEAAGDSALRIDDAALREALPPMPLVGDAASTGTPFVLDGELFYLRRNFAHENALAALLAARLDGAESLATLDVDTLFPDPADPRIADQREAVRKALGQRLFVLTGGPGTGKTTTVLRLLMALVRVSATPPRIRLAAPTGKAAQRLGESLRAASAADFPADWHDALAEVQAAETGTVHRLLGSRGARGGWSHDADHPLPAEIVVIDEASMLDLALLRGVLAALRPHTHLILVGDADQLDSVGTGSVLQDIVTVLGEGASLQRLRHSFRADRALLPLNEAVRAGDAGAFRAALADAMPQARRQALRNGAARRAALHDWTDALLAELRENGIDQPHAPDDHGRVAAHLRTLRQRQLLCALREGPFGASGVNAEIEARLAGALQTHAGAGIGEGERWYPGRRIMITRNDAASGLWNGDIGLCLRDGAGHLRAWFEADGGVRGFDIGALPPHEPAFALTVHKAQGSEYDEVALLLPPGTGHPLLSRQWFYTAISRARRTLGIWGEDDAIAQAIETPARRISGLARRIAAHRSPALA
ncbi:exodeoxyribonuclease V subunit alpha [Lysobacter pythonis]|uniref:RecBCD enzyme subunit RecD n=1 Tax=Solilutibacter pythonis TaxID=2483112 RepID=A0A3M2HJ65_9GAMM|nr:exodeoxyribonuclease V subunit alpha [Lysobacter pythonis]RMH87620.1 exodeoxyribonuclease V subunit alpha [Lysobacter pythonis]